MSSTTLSDTSKLVLAFGLGSLTASGYIWASNKYNNTKNAINDLYFNTLHTEIKTPTSKEKKYAVRTYDNDKNSYRVIKLHTRLGGNQFSGLASIINGNINNKPESINFQAYRNFMSDYNQCVKLYGTDFNLVVDLSTYGGLPECATNIGNIMLEHKGAVVAHVDEMSLSAGTLIALCADKIYYKYGACLSPIDIQVGSLFDEHTLKKIIDLENNKGHGILNILFESNKSMFNDYNNFCENLCSVKKWDVSKFKHVFKKGDYHSTLIPLHKIKDIFSDLETECVAKYNEILDE